MGKKNKRINTIENGEDNFERKTKNKKLDNSFQSDSGPSKKSEKKKNLHQNQKKAERINKTMSITDDAPITDMLCNAELDSKSKTANKLNDVDIKVNTKNKKRKSNDVAELNSVESSKVKKIKGNKVRDSNFTQGKPKNKKIVDGGRSQKGKVETQENKHKFLNEDEAEVNEEDIDKFCDEVTDEDNKTYENWVELFEANFKKKKNT